MWFLSFTITHHRHHFFHEKKLHTLYENIEVAEKFEQGMISLGKNICGDYAKTSGGQQEKNKVTQKRITPVPKRKEVLDEAGFQKAFQKLSNEFIDLKTMYSGNPSTKKNFRSFKNINRSHQPQQLTFSSPPIQGLNV